MLKIDELKQVAQENGVVAITGFDHHSTEHRDYVPRHESLRWLAIRESDLNGRNIDNLHASTGGVFLSFVGEKQDYDQRNGSIAFAHGETEQEALQDFLESQDILQSTRSHRIWNAETDTAHVIQYDPNNGKICWFNGEWIEPEVAISRFNKIVQDLKDGRGRN